MNTMIRWLETYGVEVQHGSRVVTNNLCFADDNTLISECLLHMNVLLLVTYWRTNPTCLLPQKPFKNQAYV